MTRICLNKACGRDWHSLRTKKSRCPACNSPMRKNKPGLMAPIGRPAAPKFDSRNPAAPSRPSSFQSRPVVVKS